MREMFKKLIFRNIASPVRLVTDLFDRAYITPSERELQKNILKVRAFIKELILVRKEEIQSGGPKKVDFLSIIIEDELYKDNIEMMIDDCCNFMIASTQTTSIMVSETLFRLNQDKTIL